MFRGCLVVTSTDWDESGQTGGLDTPVARHTGVRFDLSKQHSTVNSKVFIGLFDNGAFSLCALARSWCGISRLLEQGPKDGLHKTGRNLKIGSL